MTIAGITNYYPSVTKESTNISTKTKEAVEVCGNILDVVKSAENAMAAMKIGVKSRIEYGLMTVRR